MKELRARVYSTIPFTLLGDPSVERTVVPAPVLFCINAVFEDDHHPFDQKILRTSQTMIGRMRVSSMSRSVTRAEMLMNVIVGLIASRTGR